MKDLTLRWISAKDFPLWLLRALAYNGIFRVWQVIERSPSEFLDVKGIDIKGMTLISEWQQEWKQAQKLLEAV